MLLMMVMMLVMWCGSACKCKLQELWPSENRKLSQSAPSWINLFEIWTCWGSVSNRFGSGKMLVRSLPLLLQMMHSINMSSWQGQYGKRSPKICNKFREKAEKEPCDHFCSSIFPVLHFIARCSVNGTLRVIGWVLLLLIDILILREYNKYRIW